MRRILLLVSVSFGWVGSAAADGLFYRLPADGEFAGYVVEVSFSTKGLEVAGRGNATMSSVGQETVKGKKCRWIEIKLALTVMDMEDIQVAKVLVPEEHLKAGASPLEHAIKGWIKRRDEQPTAINDFKSMNSPLPIFLGGPLKDAKKLPKQVTASKLGKIECEGITGSYELDDGKESVKAVFENRLHDKAPFGLVTSTIQLTMQRNGQVEGTGTMSFRLVASGKDAKSELVEQK